MGADDPLAARLGITVDVAPRRTLAGTLNAVADAVVYAALVAIAYVVLHVADAFESRRDPRAWRLGVAVALALALAAIAAARS